MGVVTLWIANALATYGFTVGLDKLFNNEASFSKQLHKVIDKTIDDYSKKHPQNNEGRSFPFYKSQVIIEELLKTRLFSKDGYNFNENTIQDALEQHPNILKPTNEQLAEFIKLFDKYLRGDEQLKKLELDEFQTEKIFEIYKKVDEVLSLLQIHLVEEVGLLKEEYHEEIKECYEDIKALKPKTALKRINALEKRIEENSKHIPNKLKANLLFVKGLCYESLGNATESYECFVNAHKSNPTHKQYQEKACISYYLLKDKSYVELLSIIESWSKFNEVIWAIKTLEDKNVIKFIKTSIPSPVFVKHKFKRLVLNNLLANPKYDNLLLLESLQFSKISKQLPVLIDYDNLHHWVFMFNGAFIKYIYRANIPFVGFIKKHELSNFLLQLGVALSERIRHSELGKEYNTIVFFTTWFESEIDNKSDTIIRLNETFKSIEKKDSLITFLFANAVQKHTSKSEAVKIIDSYDGKLDEYLLSLKTFCNLSEPDSLDSILEYFNSIDKIDELNIPNVCNFMVPIASKKLISKRKLIEIIETIKFSNEYFRRLILLIYESYSKEDSPIKVCELIELKDNLLTESSLFFFIALTYFENGYFSDCTKFMKPYVDETTESRDLFLYIKTLDQQKESGQLELLRLLQLWRENYSFIEDLLKIEIELRRLLHDWEKILVISKYGLEKMPNDEGFYTFYMVALSLLKKSNQIAEEITKVVSFKFNVTNNALRIAKILIDFDYEKEGLEIVYQKAINKSDTDARMSFFMLSSELNDDYFKAFDVVEKGMYVKYEIDGEHKIIPVNDKSITDPVVESSIGKQNLETFKIKSKFGHSIKQVKIVRIMDKYLALAVDIIDEVGSSFSNIPMQKITFDGENIESIEKSLLDNFGVEQEQINKRREQSLKNYFAYKLSYIELVISNFEDNYIDAYYYLTSNQSNGFQTIPLKYNKLDLNIKYENIVIDFTSGLLFFELSKKVDLKFSNLVVAESLYKMIDTIIAKAISQKKSSITVTFQQNKIKPHFYSEGFHENRINYLIQIKKWFKENTEAIVPEERIEVIRALTNKGGISLSFEFFVDTFLLGKRENNILVSDDLGYIKVLNSQKKLSSSENFLIKNFKNSKQDITNYMLSQKYIGVTIDKDILYNAYTGRLKTNDDVIYYYALRNISLKENYNDSNINVVVDCLQEIALNGTITPSQYKIDATNLLFMLLVGFPKPQHYLKLKESIINKFELLGDYFDITFEALLDALTIINKR